MELKDIKPVYLVGVGGTGMSVIARHFLHKGLKVVGYDKAPSEFTRILEKEGIGTYYKKNAQLILVACKESASASVIYIPTIPLNHVELIYSCKNGSEVQKRTQVLDILAQTYKGLCFARTYGKTTTSSMCVYLIRQSHPDRNASLGDISESYGINYILSGRSDSVMIEADEFDRFSHRLRFRMSVITSANPDHLDIYDTKKVYLESLRHYIELIQRGGALVIRKGLETKPNVQEGVRIHGYGRDEGSSHTGNIRIANRTITFDFSSPIKSIRGIELGQPIPINIKDGVSVMAMA